MDNSVDWFWRMQMGLPPRQVDLKALMRIAPELFGSELEMSQIITDKMPGSDLFPTPLVVEISRWLRAKGHHAIFSTTTRCDRPDCPLKMGDLQEQSVTPAIIQDDSFVIELMTVAGGYKKQANIFFDMARKIHASSSRGPITSLLVTDPFIYLDKSEDGTAGGIDNFKMYLDCLEISKSGLVIYQPPYAKGEKVKGGEVWRRSVTHYLEAREIYADFTYFRATTGKRFHDRFYLARHKNGSVSGLFGPSMNSLNDSSFVLVGEIEAQTLKRLCSHIELWH